MFIPLTIILLHPSFVHSIWCLPLFSDTLSFSNTVFLIPPIRCVSPSIHPLTHPFIQSPLSLSGLCIQYLVNSYSLLIIHTVSWSSIQSSVQQYILSFILKPYRPYCQSRTREKDDHERDRRNENKEVMNEKIKAVRRDKRREVKRYILKEVPFFSKLFFRAIPSL